MRKDLQRTDRVLLSAGILFSHPAGADWPNLSAGDLLPRIPGRLTGEIIHACVDDDRLSNDLPHAKTVCQNRLEGITPVSKEGRQVTGVVGMGAVSGIIVGKGVSKGIALVSGTALSPMDVKSKDSALAILI